MNPNSAELINSMLVPGILIVASAILLYSTNSRYSLVVDRIRLLMEERADNAVKTSSRKELMSKLDKIELQISHLIRRISMVRITIVSYSAALLFFSVSCVLIGIRSNFEVNSYFWVAISFFFGGLLGIINGVVFSVIEVFKGYRIVHIEISEINRDAKE
ncbi:MAG: DUF2721 domain-containing protein [Bacteroidales bacterium]